MSGETEFSLTAQDNVDAVRTHMRGITGKLSWILLGVAFLFPVVDLVAGMSILEDMPFFFFLGLAILFLVWDFAARDWTVRRAFRQSEPMRSPLQVSWDDEAITIVTNTSNARYAWSQFFRWAGSRTSLLLYRDSQMFIFIPRRALQDGQFEDMTSALRMSGVPERGGRQSAHSSPISR